MAKLPSRPTFKPTFKPGLHRLPVAEIEKLLSKAHKVSEEALAEVARFQMLLDERKHAYRMELGSKAVLRRLIHLSEKTWSGLAGRLEGTLPEEADHEHLMYWLENRPKPESESPQPAEKTADPARHETRSFAKDLAQESSQAAAPNGQETGKNPAPTHSSNADLDTMKMAGDAASSTRG